MDFVNLVRQLIYSENKTIAEVSRECMDNASSLSGLLTGSKAMSPRTFVKIIKCLELDKRPVQLKIYLLCYLMDRLPLDDRETLLRKAKLWTDAEEAEYERLFDVEMPEGADANRSGQTIEEINLSRVKEVSVRRVQILHELVAAEKALTPKDLQSKLKVSDQTLLKDLSAMTRARLVKRFYVNTKGWRFGSQRKYRTVEFAITDKGRKAISYRRPGQR